MALESIRKINVDFSNQKYILVNAKQNDRKSRFLEVSCYDNEQRFPLNSSHAAYIRYKKADDYGVFNFCKINNGNVLVEFTEQMLAVAGICYADLVIINKGDASLDSNTGEVTHIENSAILSTMTFCIDVIETAVDNLDIESEYEINFLNETLEKYEAYYENVVKTAKSWAEGNTGVRDGENTANAKYYADLAKQYAAGSSVIGVKGDKETEYRIGEVNITSENVGAIPTADIAPVAEVKDYLGI